MWKRWNVWSRAERSIALTGLLVTITIILIANG